MRRVPEDMLSAFMEGVGGASTCSIETRKPIERGPRAVSSMGALFLLFDKKIAAAISKKEKISIVSQADSELVWQESKLNRYWEPWNKPNPSLPIDTCIFDLINGAGRKSSARIIDRNEFYELGLMNGLTGNKCPYEYVRHELGRAVGIAYDDLHRDQVRRNKLLPELAQISSWCEQVDAKINRILSQIEETGLGPAPGIYNDTDDNRIHSRNITKIYADKIAETLDVYSEVSNAAKIKRSSLIKSGRAEEVWWVSFIIRCGIIWSTLTGSIPKKGQKAFENFIRAANESLGGKRHEFDSQIDTALDRVSNMEPWDKFDSMFKVVNRSGLTSLAILGPLPAAFVGSSGRHLLKAAELVVLARQGSAQAATDLMAFLAAASDEDRDSIAKLMARPIKTPRFGSGALVN